MKSIDQTFDICDLISKQLHNIHITERTNLLQIKECDVSVFPCIADNLIHINQLLIIKRNRIEEGTELCLYRFICNSDLYS